MAIPIAVTNYPMGSPSINAYSGAPFNVALDGTASFDPDLGSITAYSWTLAYSPPGSGASLLNPATSTPTLQNIDVEGTYLVFLQVTDSGAENSEPVQRLAPDSAFAVIVHQTQNEAFRIPASGERNWADVVYDMWMALDDDLNSGGIWDVDHQLFFSTGNTPEIRDSFPGASKDGRTGLLVNGAAVNADYPLGTSYYGLTVKPGQQVNVLGAPVTALRLQGGDVGMFIEDPAGGGAAALGGGLPLGIRIDFGGSIGRFGLLMRSTNVAQLPGDILTYTGVDAAANVGSIGLKGHRDNYTLATVGGPWGTVNPIPPNTPNPRFTFSTPRLALGRLILDSRPGNTQVMGAGGGVQWFTNIGAGALAVEQDIVMGRVVREDVAAVTGGQDFGLVWRESIVELAAVPPDPAIFPPRTLVMRRPDAAEWSVPGVGVMRASDFVPMERPAVFTYTESNVNPAANNLAEVPVTVTIPSGYLSQPGYDDESFLAAEVVPRALQFDGPVVATDLTYLSGPDRIQCNVRYQDKNEIVTGIITFATGSPPAGDSAGGTEVLASAIKTGQDQKVVILLTPFLDGTVAAPANSWTVKLDQKTFAADDLTQFSYLVEPVDPVDALPASVKFQYAIITFKEFFTNDQFDVKFQGLTRVTI